MCLLNYNIYSKGELSHYHNVVFKCLYFLSLSIAFKMRYSVSYG